MIVLSNRTHFSGWLQLLNNFNTIFTEKLFSENILCLLLLSALAHQMLWWAKSWYFLAIKHIFWMVTIVEQLQQNFHEKFLSENILSHCFLSEMFFRAPKLGFLAIKFILLAGHDCWKSLLKLQLYRAVLSSCPAKNS